MRNEKQLLLDEIRDQMDHYDSFLILSYLGFTANQANDFRRLVAKTGGNVEMVPKRLLYKAAHEIGLDLDLNSLTGHISVVFTGQDPIETTKAVYEYKKEHKEKLQVLGGHVDGSLLDQENMDTLSKLPGKDELRAQFLGLLQAPLTQTLSTMNALVCSVIYCLDNKCKNEDQK